MRRHRKRALSHRYSEAAASLFIAVLAAAALKTPASGNEQSAGTVPTVPLGAEIAPSLFQLEGSTLRTLKKPVSVAAFTLKANTTPEAIVGAPGELVLGRVALAPQQ